MEPWPPALRDIAILVAALLSGGIALIIQNWTRR